MDTVILVTFRVNGLPIKIKIASESEPSTDQLYAKIQDIANVYKINGEIHLKKVLHEKGNKMYIYHIGENKCVVLVEKLEKIMELDK
ncbi:hypothetical protein [Bacillus sp. T33-2]|uniref:hypothetical protein n=1 Tax=Bacillus sp. T33-2 TaxID=2054168 RepID=UPI000C76DBBC|nr:hypothetical protein [Bacillus sp. T33-2]PLR91157.1 hypothetical protein CVD19_22030 [Bacillus sp. T33-2]